MGFKGWTTFLNFVHRRPLVTALGFGLVNVTMADVVTQTMIEKRSFFDNYNWRSTKTIVSLGLMSVLVDYWTINKVCWYLFPKKNIPHTLYKVFFDQFVVETIFYFPVFYYLRELMYSDKDWDDINGNNGSKIDYHTQLFSIGLNKYFHNAKQDLTSTWILWVPGQVITFGMLSKPWRLPFMQLLAFVWFIGLSYYRADSNYL